MEDQVKILLTIFVLSVATLFVCFVYEALDPRNDTTATIGGLAVVSTFVSGLLAALLFIWS